MCLWILTACLGLLPGNPSPAVVVPGVPSPIIVPTAAPTTTTTTTTTTTARPPTTGNTPTVPTTIPVMTVATVAPTQPPTTVSVITTVTTPLPTTVPPTMTTTTTTTPAPPTTLPVTTVAPNIGGILLPLVICSNPTAVCLVNPNESTAGPIPIDPRLGTTPASSAAIRMPPVTGYSARTPSYDVPVKFPRLRRNVWNKYLKNRKYTLYTTSETKSTHKIVKRQNCACVPAGTCIRNFIDIRIITPSMMCPSGQEYCCGNSSNSGGAIISCGLTQTVPPTSVPPAPGQADFGEFPWQGAILTAQDYYGGGVLIDNLNVLTVAHLNFTEIPTNLTVRLGEWDGVQPDPVPYQEYLVSKIIRHTSYNPNTLQNDIAILRLAAAVPFTPSAGAAVTINRVCLPPSTSTVYTGQRCKVAGWGNQIFGPTGVLQTIIKKVDVPILDPATCQSLLRTARLGSNFVLDATSFLCAGGETDKDACTGDRGSGLVCQVDGKWTLVGLVAWGLGCGNTNVPGVYVNVASFLPWIQQQIATP